MSVFIFFLRQCDGWNLVANAFAHPGWHDDQAVTLVQNLFDDSGLISAKLIVPKHVFQDFNWQFAVGHQVIKDRVKLTKEIEKQLNYRNSCPDKVFSIVLDSAYPTIENRIFYVLSIVFRVKQMLKIHSWQRSSCTLAFVLAFLSLTALPCLGSADEVIKPLNEYSGKVANQMLIMKMPRSAVVQDQRAWNQLWKAWRPNKPIEKVDFQKQIVLVETTVGPNSILASGLFLKEGGDLRYSLNKSKNEGTGFSYLMMVIPKANVNSINGQILLDNSPSPSASANTPIVPVAADKGTIQVEIDGQIRTGMRTTDGSTPARITAKGIVWELDFQNDPALAAAAKALGTKYGIVRGKLIQISGENKFYDNRWVVLVDSVSPSNTIEDISDPATPNNPSIANNNTSPGGPAAPIQPLMNNATNPALATPIQRTPIPSRTEHPTRRTSPLPEGLNLAFSSILIKLTAGKRGDERLQHVASDGLVKMEVPSRKFVDTFNLSQNDLIKLHNFVKNTNWRNVKQNPAANAIGVSRYEITIETYDGALRFTIDQATLGKSKEFNEMFSYMSRPKQ